MPKNYHKHSNKQTLHDFFRLFGHLDGRLVILTLWLKMFLSFCLVLMEYIVVCTSQNTQQNQKTKVISLTNLTNQA